jgi:hypothetical protein
MSEAAVYLLLVPPIAVAITLLVIAVRRYAAGRAASSGDAMEAHRRCLEALDPRAASRKAAQQALQEGQQPTSRIHRHA